MTRTVIEMKDTPAAPFFQQSRLGQFQHELRNAGDEVHLIVNSLGGDPFPALDMYEALRGSGKTVTAEIVGVAASAATVPICAASHVRMRERALLMIHEPRAKTGGTIEQLQQSVEMLEDITEMVVHAYQSRSFLPDNQIRRMMAEETWMNGPKAVELGFADEVIEADAVMLHEGSLTTARRLTKRPIPALAMQLLR